MQAGYSVENAVVSVCQRSGAACMPKDADIVKEFRYMESQLQCQCSGRRTVSGVLESAVELKIWRILRQSFTQRSGQEEI